MEVGTISTSTGVPIISVEVDGSRAPIEVTYLVYFFGVAAGLRFHGSKFEQLPRASMSSHGSIKEASMDVNYNVN